MSQTSSEVLENQAEFKPESSPKSSPTRKKSHEVTRWDFWTLKLNRMINSEIKWKNCCAAKGGSYNPTQIEHIANVATHGFWILPSIYGMALLIMRSKNSLQMQSAIIYGTCLSFLFIISTSYHYFAYRSKNKIMKDLLHRLDRGMIYIFICGSYHPWLELGNLSHQNVVQFLKWSIWGVGFLGIMYQQLFHERFKNLETFFYVLIGVGPSFVILWFKHDFEGMAELKIGGFIYLLGIFFFKADGILPMAHSLWHCGVSGAASIHFFAILDNLYPKDKLPIT